MNIEAIVRRLNNRIVSAGVLNRYFDTKSVDELLQELRRLANDDYLEFEVSLSTEYFDWQNAHRNVILANDINYGTNLGYESLDKQDINGLSINSSRSLEYEEVVEVVRKLPLSIANQYLRFKLRNIDSERFIKLLTKRNEADDDAFYDRVEYNGLVVDGAEIWYRGEAIKMSFGHRQAVRLLVSKRGGLCYRDEFTDRHASIFKHPAAHYKDINATLRKLIGEIRKELAIVIKNDCIENEPGEGWRLKLEP